MPIKWKIFPAISLIAFFNSASPQSLQKGNYVSHLKFGNVVNYKSDSLGLGEFKGKLVILDFWGFTCISCLRSFPKLDSMQSMFKDKVQIILVNMESKDSTIKFFQQRPKLRKPDLPMITGNKYLSQLFPHNGVPFHVWIDTAGKFMFRTSGLNTTKEKISAYLLGRSVNLPDAAKAYYPVHSFIDPVWEPSLSYCSYISKCITTIDYGPTNKVPGLFQIQSQCASIVELYQKAFRGFSNVDYDQPWKVVLELNEPEKYTRPAASDVDNYNEWVAHNSYNYHLMWPEEDKRNASEIMRSDLDRYFGLESQVQIKSVRSLVLVRTSKVDKLKSKGGKPVNTLIPADEKTTRVDSVRYFWNQPYDELSLRLKLFIEQKLVIPFIDSTGFKENIDFKMSGDALDNLTLDKFSIELAQYDLALEIKEVKTDVLILKKRVNTDNKNIVSGIE